MTASEIVFGLLLAVAGMLIVSGVWMIAEPAGRICAGILGAGWAWLMFAEVDK